MTPKFIKKHPTPWKLATVSHPKFRDLDRHQEIQDANGRTVIAAYDAESYWAGLEGAEALIKFINAQYPKEAK